MVEVKPLLQRSLLQNKKMLIAHQGIDGSFQTSQHILSLGFEDSGEF